MCDVDVNEKLGLEEESRQAPWLSLEVTRCDACMIE
jgi:hypothetical protein